jgi:hypothetical protein
MRCTPTKAPCEDRGVPPQLHETRSFLAPEFPGSPQVKLLYFVIDIVIFHVILQPAEDVVIRKPEFTKPMARELAGVKAWVADHESLGIEGAPKMALHLNTTPTRTKVVSKLRTEPDDDLTLY